MIETFLFRDFLFQILELDEIPPDGWGFGGRVGCQRYCNKDDPVIWRKCHICAAPLKRLDTDGFTCLCCLQSLAVKADSDLPIFG